MQLYYHRSQIWETDEETFASGYVDASAWVSISRSNVTFHESLAKLPMIVRTVFYFG